MYWSDLEFKTIERARLDGSNHTTFVHGRNIKAFGMAIDYDNNELLWCNQLDSTLNSIKLDQTDRRVINSANLSTCMALTVMDNYIYCLDM